MDDIIKFIVLLASVLIPSSTFAAPTSAVVGGLETTLVGEQRERERERERIPLSAAAPSTSTTNKPRTPVDGVRPCLVDDVIWQHGQQVVRADQCEFCLCFDGELFCWWQNCPPTTARGPCQGTEPFTPCNAFSDSGNATDEEVITAAVATVPSTISRSASDATSTLATTSTSQVPTTSTENPVLCKILGTVYRVGDVLPRDTGSCLQCECGPHGRIVCGPKDCLPVRDSETGASANSLDMFDVDTF